MQTPDSKLRPKNKYISDTNLRAFFVAITFLYKKFEICPKMFVTRQWFKFGTFYLKSRIETTASL